MKEYLNRHIQFDEGSCEDCGELINNAEGKLCRACSARDEDG